jgi:hypothetical protein
VAEPAREPEPDLPPEPDAPPEPAREPEPEPLVDARRLLAVADGPPLAPEEPDGADRGPLLPLELLGWDGTDHLVGVRCSEGVVLRSGRPPTRRTLQVKRLTRWARAGRLTLHCEDGDVEVRLLAPGEYADVALGDARSGRVAGPLRMARSGQLSARRDQALQALVARVLRVAPDVQVGNQ